MADNFYPSETIKLSVTSTNTQGTFRNTGKISNLTALRVRNKGPNEACIVWGKTPQMATTANMSIGNGGVEIYTRDPADAYFAAICNSGETATIEVTTGVGS